MLVLTRKIGEEIIIGGGITIRVASIQGSRVKIGIDAPANVLIQRSEIAERFEVWRERAAAARDRLAGKVCVH